MKNIKDLTILYIDFEENKKEDYLTLFKKRAKKVYFVSDIESAYLVYSQYKPDIIIIELLVPQAIEMVKKIREKDDKVCLMALTEDSSIELLQEIVELFFSSYLVKPVSTKVIEKELSKVVKKIDCRGNIYLPLFCQWNIKSKTLLYKDNIVSLTKRESRLFQLLIEKRGNFCSDEEILFFVWGDDFDKSITNSSIRTLVKNLRKKVPKGLIENQYSVGYKINFEVPKDT